MAEVTRQSDGEESPVGVACDFTLVEPPAVKGSTSDGSMDSRTGRQTLADISLNMDDACDTPLPSKPKIQVQRSLSRKGRLLGEGKAQHHQDDDWSKPHKGSALDEKCRSVVLPISVMDGSCQQSVMGERRMKRSRLAWLDSRKVFMIFASLSSMGTIMLIYLTLSVGRVNCHDSQD